jgi:hypothetical protein
MANKPSNTYIMTVHGGALGQKTQAVFCFMEDPEAKFNDLVENWYGDVKASYCKTTLKTVAMLEAELDGAVQARIAELNAEQPDPAKHQVFEKQGKRIYTLGTLEMSKVIRELTDSKVCKTLGREQKEADPNAGKGVASKAITTPAVPAVVATPPAPVPTPVAEVATAKTGGRKKKTDAVPAVVATPAPVAVVTPPPAIAPPVIVDDSVAVPTNKPKGGRKGKAKQITLTDGNESADAVNA